MLIWVLDLYKYRGSPWSQLRWIAPVTESSFLAATSHLLRYITRYKLVWRELCRKKCSWRSGLQSWQSRVKVAARNILSSPCRDSTVAANSLQICHAFATHLPCLLPHLLPRVCCNSTVTANSRQTQNASCRDFDAIVSRVKSCVKTRVKVAANLASKLVSNSWQISRQNSRKILPSKNKIKNI
jgi:hypothetical protein